MSCLRIHMLISISGPINIEVLLSWLINNNFQNPRRLKTRLLENMMGLFGDGIWPEMWPKKWPFCEGVCWCFWLTTRLIISKHTLYMVRNLVRWQYSASKLIQRRLFTQWLPLFAGHSAPQRQKQQNHLKMSILAIIVNTNNTIVNENKSPMTTKFAKTP